MRQKKLNKKEISFLEFEIILFYQCFKKFNLLAHLLQ